MGEIKLEVTDEMKEIWLDYSSALGCRNECIKSVFKTKKAIYYGKQAEKSRVRFWKLARSLHPSFNSSVLTYSSDTGLITVKEDENA